MSGADTPSAEQLLAALDDEAILAIVRSFELAWLRIAEADYDRASQMAADEHAAELDPLYPLVTAEHAERIRRKAEREARLAG